MRERLNEEILRRIQRKIYTMFSYLTDKKQDVSGLFEEFGIENCGEEIILSREITPTSSRARVNGSLVNQEFMKIFRELFLDIHSQHQTYSFLQPKYHITLLDDKSGYTRECKYYFEQITIKEYIKLTIHGFGQTLSN